MKVDPTINLAEFVDIVRTAMGAKFPDCCIGHITIDSYGQKKIEIDETDKVTAVEFSHRATS